MKESNAYRSLAVTLVMLLVAGVAEGGTYVVSPQGNDSNPGTLDQPWQTIYKANRTLLPGDTVLVREGTYQEQIRPQRDGEAGRPIVYTAMEGENAVIEGEAGNLIVVVASSYTVIEGFTIRCQAYLNVLETAEYWIHLVGNHITLRRCRVIADGDAAYNYGTLKAYSRAVVVSGKYNVVEQCYIRGQMMGVVIAGRLPRFTILRNDTLVNNGSSNVVILADDDPGRLDQTIQGTLIEDCVMDTSWDEDNIQFEPNYEDNTHTYNNGTIIRRSRLGHAAENCIDFKGAGNVLVDECLLYSCEGDNNGRFDGPDEGGGAGLNLGLGEISQYVIVRRSVLWDNHTGAYMYDGYRYYNNVFLNNRRSYRGSNGDPIGNGYSGAEIWNKPAFKRAFLNNILGMQPNRGVLNLDFDSGGNFYLNNNLYFGPDVPVKFFHSMTIPKTTTEGLANWQENLNTYSGYAYLGGKEANSIEADPQFVNVPVYLTDYDEGWNFGLSQSSPAIDAGRPVTNAIGDGSGSQMLSVGDVRFFCDGFGVTDGDLIKIGSGDPVRITGIDTLANTITLESPRSWSNGEGVHIAFEGAAPDIGAVEFVSGALQAPATPELTAPPAGASDVAQPIELSWAPTAATLAYYPQVASDAEFRTIVVNPGAITETSYSVSGLNGGTTYYWRVRAGNGTGVSPWSSVRSFTTHAALNPPATPELIAPSAGASNLVQPVELSWNSTAAAIAYYPQVATDAEFGTIVVNPGAITGTSYSLSGLAEGTTYYWRVRSGNDGGVSAWSAVRLFATRTNTPNAPATPGLVSPVDGASGLPRQVELKWRKTSATLVYYPQIGQHPGFDSLAVNPGGIAETTYAVTDLTPGTTYYWRVRSSNEGGESAWSPSRSFATQLAAPGVPNTSLPTSESSGVTTNPLLAWNSVTDASSYSVQVSTASTFNTLVVDQQGITELSFLVEGLNTGTTYYWRVRATGSGGIGAWSAVASFTTFEFTQGSAGNIVQNPDFQGGTSGWEFVGTGSSTFTVSSEGYLDASAAKITITEASAPVQLYQDNVVLNPDSGYSITFAARSSAGNDCEVSVMKSCPPYTNYGVSKSRIDLGTTWKVFSVDLEPTGITAPVNDARLLFDLGAYAASGDVVLLDQIAILIGDAPMPPVDPLPKDYFLEENYPNPFNPNTTIQYTLPADGRVVVTVINLLGQEVARLVDGFQARGRHEAVLDLHGHASGVYLVTLIAGEYIQTRKVMMVK